MPRSRVSLFIAFALLVGLSVAPRAEAPDLELNPHTGFVESVDIATESDNRVRHVIDMGQAGRIVALLSSAAGATPRLAIKTGGDSWVAWTHDGTTDQVLYAVRDESEETWSGEASVSAPDEDARNPEIVHFGGSARVAYEATASGTTSVIVAAISDDPDPLITRMTVGSTDFAGNVDVLVHAESGHLWLTWVHSSTEVGWSEYDTASSTWDAVSYRSYQASSVPVARKAIRNTVLGL